MASGPITLRQINGETMETVTDFFFFFGQGPKSLCTVTAAMKLKDASSLEGRTNLDSILKSRDFTLPTNFCTVKAIFFYSSPVQM